MQKNTKTPKPKPNKNGVLSTPLANQLVKIYGSKLQPLLERHNHIAYSFHDECLLLSITKIFISIGFKVHSTVSQNEEQLMKHLPFWLQHKNLVLLHYHSKSGNMNFINLLRGIKRLNPKATFTHLIPVFYTNYSSKKEMEIFQIMGAIGIKHVIFLTPDFPVEVNVEEILKQLDIYTGKSMEQDKTGETEDDVEDEKIRKYYLFLDKGMDYMKRGCYEEAINCFSKAIALNPDYTVLLKRGDAYYKNIKFPEALLDYNEAAKVEKIISEPYAKAGACCFQIIRNELSGGNEEEIRQQVYDGLNYLRQAKTLVDEYIERNSSSPEKISNDPYEHIIQTLAVADISKLGIKEVEEELRQLTQEVIEKIGDINFFSSTIDSDVRIDYAMLLTRQKEYYKAETIFRKVIQDSPSIAAPAFNNFAIELRKNGQYGKAFDTYKELLEYPNIPDRGIILENMKNAGLHHGRALRKESNCEQAITVYKAIAEKKPLNTEWVFCEMAMTYLEKNDKENACNAFMEAMFQEPDIMKEPAFKNYKKLTGLKKEIIKKLS